MGRLAERDGLLDPEDVNSTPAAASRNATPDPNDEIPVPVAMSPAEIDERAQVVDALRRESGTDLDEETIQP